MAFLKEGKTNWKCILIVVVLAALVSGGILWWTKTQEVPLVELPEIKKPEKVVKDETADWKTYRNEEYGFEVKYPNNWKIIEGPSGSDFHLRSVEETKHFDLCDVFVENRNNQTVEQWLSGEPNRYTKIKNIIVDRHNGVLADDIFTMGNTYKVAIFPYQNYMILAGCNAFLIDKLEKILSTFRFLE